MNENSVVKPHGVQKGVQETLFKQTKALVVEIEETGNPFMEDSNQLFTFYTKDVAGQAVGEKVEELNFMHGTV